ncbi:hypothetical protein [Brevundimonas sp.]|uniref:hypothetical protein n=1 Tax=Brevundimonas sp. TaxID=1871086 RepID=UPI0035AF3C6E
MISTVWKNRLAAAAVVGLIGLSLPPLVKAIGAVLAVREAEASATEAAQTVPAAAPIPATLRPLLKRGAATPEIAIGEYLNLRLSDLGYSATAVQVVSARPLGRGLQLAEVRLEGAGDVAALAAVANWVGVNRDAVRLKSLSTTQGPDGSARSTLVLLMVIA